MLKLVNLKFIYFLFLCINYYVGLGQNSFGIQLLDNWTDTNITVGPGEVRYSDCFGFNYGDQNYAVIGSTEGAHFLKIANFEIEFLEFHRGADFGKTIQHRDFKKYRNYIYAVCDEGESTLQIFDISYLPDSVHKVYDSNEHFTICHNIFIDTLNAKLYACGPDNIGLKILDLTIPTEPELWLNFTNISYIHDCYVNNDTAFLNAGVDGLKIYYFNNNTVPIELGVLNSYQEKGYNHSGWLDETKLIYCFVDETIGKKIKYCELDNGVENIQVDALFGTKDALDNVPHNIYLSNGFAFVSYYNEGLRIFDLNSSPIQQIAFYDTYPIESDFKLHGAWGVYVFEEDEIIILSDRQSGLFSFYFPFKSFRNLKNDQQVYGIPFINSSTKVIINPHNSIGLKFNVYALSGQILYQEELIKNWVNIPLNLSSGEYVYQLISDSGKLKYSGKFVILSN